MKQDATGSKTLAASVLLSMRKDIIELNLEPGAKLPFESLRTKYETGLSPIREALSKLSAEGLVIGEDQKGYRVAPLTEEDFRDLTFLRREVEVLAVTKSVRLGGDAWEADLVRAFHHMVIASSEIGAAYPEEWAARHDAFHEALVSGCGSPRLILLRRNLFGHFMRYQRIAPKHVWKNSIKDTEHKAIVDAALARDIPLVTTLVKNHIKVLESIMDAL